MDKQLLKTVTIIPYSHYLTITILHITPTTYNIPSFIVVNGVLNSSVISITSYTIIIIVTDICHCVCLQEIALSLQQGVKLEI